MRRLIGVCVLALLACGSPTSGRSRPTPARVTITEAYRVVLAPDGTLIVPAGHTNRVLRFNPSNQLVTVVVGDGGPSFRDGASDAASVSIGLPRDAAVQSSGAAVIALDSARLARVDTRTRRLSIIAGTGVVGFRGDGGQATGASLDDPLAVAVDGTGDLVVAEAGNRIRRIDRSGVNRTIAGRAHPTAIASRMVAEV